MVILFVDVEVFAQLLNFVGQEGDLNLRRTGIALSLGELFDYFIFVIW